MIVLVALIVVLVAVPATLVLVALTLAGSAFAAAVDGTLRPADPGDVGESRAQPSPGPASAI
ncbi:MAG TPA: hypothetical protein VFT20_16080 [Candidatus Limnocylindrales bacterium]|nr:hypothetical protein [Candidatus Limnocylindrales bacterium]